MLADVVNNFLNMFFEIYGIDPVHFLSALWLAWKVTLKKIKVKLYLLTDIDILLIIVEKGIRSGICLATKGNNKYMNNYDKSKESSYR